MLHQVNEMNILSESHEPVLNTSSWSFKENYSRPSFAENVEGFTRYLSYLLETNTAVSPNCSYLHEGIWEENT